MAKVYFLKTNEIAKIRDFFPPLPTPVAIKTHFGEEGNVTYLPSSFVKEIAAMVEKPVLTETSVLYRSPRSKAVTHREIALSHGYDFAPIDFLDGEEGDDAMEIKICGDHFKTCYLGRGLVKYGSLLVVSHFKGHYPAGFGGALKNLGMGLASRRGKLAMHASVPHSVEADICVGCGTCINHCPVQAIDFDTRRKAVIDPQKCISCSKCISVCPREAIKIPWDSHGGKMLQERIAEYASAAVVGRSCFYINFLINITKSCDCYDGPMEKLTPDIGILCTNDPVAIDQASFDLVCRQYGEFKKYNGEAQLIQAVKLKLGERGYKLISP
jgi:uncharacterized protein